MSYGSWNTFTRKQCNVLYKAFKRGELTPPKDCRGKVKKPGFVYNYEDAHWRHGMYLTREEDLFNGQLGILQLVVGLVIAGDYEQAQSWLDGTHDDIYSWMPEWVEPSKMWKVVG